MNFEDIAHNLALLRIKELDLSTYDNLSICYRYMEEYNSFVENLKIVNSEEYIKAKKAQEEELKKCFGDF